MVGSLSSIQWLHVFLARKYRWVYWQGSTHVKTWQFLPRTGGLQARDCAEGTLIRGDANQEIAVSGELEMLGFTLRAGFAVTVFFQL
jgi:hypothetical protein